MKMLALWIFIYLSIAILVVGAVLYKKAYKSNMNKALDGEARQGLFEPAQIIYILAVVVLIILSSITISKVNSINNSLSIVRDRVNYLEWQNSNLTNVIHNLEGSLNDYFEDHELIQNYEIELIDISEEELFIYNLTFTLLEKENESTVSVVIKDNDNNTIIIPVSSSSLVYTVDLEFEYEQIYNIDVMIEGTSTIQKQITEIDVLDQIEKLVWFQFEYIESDDENELETFGLTVVNQEGIPNELKTSTVKYEIFIDGELTETYNLHEKTKTVNGLDIFQLVYDISYKDMGTFTVTVTITDNMGNEQVVRTGL
jgi:hypothetical protein